MAAPREDLQDQAEFLLAKPPAGGVWLDKDDVELVLQALEEGREAQKKLAGFLAAVATVSPVAPVKRKRAIPPAQPLPAGATGGVRDLCRNCKHPKIVHQGGETYCNAHLEDLTQCNCLKFTPPERTAAELLGRGDNENPREGEPREGETYDADSTPRCAACGTATDRTCDPEAVGERVAPFSGKPLCVRCEDKLVDRCTGTNLSAGIACTARAAPGCNGRCRRHKKQPPGDIPGHTEPPTIPEPTPVPPNGEALSS